MMCIKYSENIICAPKVRHKIYTPFIHTSLIIFFTFGGYKQTDLNSFLPPSLSLSFFLSTYLSPYLT